jgi:hypothetical protein
MILSVLCFAQPSSKQESKKIGTSVLHLFKPNAKKKLFCLVLRDYLSRALVYVYLRKKENEPQEPNGFYFQR